LTVAAPWVIPGHAEQVAAEHFAFCPDNIVQGAAGTIGAYAARYVLGEADWWFWWDWPRGPATFTWLLSVSVLN
jgi:hypothetical protein